MIKKFKLNAILNYDEDNRSKIEAELQTTV